MTDVALSEEQLLLVEACTRLVDRAAVGSPPPGTRAAVDEEAWSALVDAGFVAMRAPSSAGGGDASAVDVALVVEQLARGPVAVPYLGTVLALELARLVGEGGGDRGREVVESVVAGRRHGVVLDHGLGRFDERGVALDAEPGDPVLGLRWSGGTAEVVRAVAGSALDSVDLARPLATVVTEGPTGSPVGPGSTRWSSTGSGAPTIVLGAIDDDAEARLEAYALTLLCADLLGAMHAALDGAVAYARDRVQFGQPVGAFQAVQHLCAEALVSVESARSIMWQAAWAVDAEAPSVALEAARVAKAHCSPVALEVVEAAIQVWGGPGITWECPAHLHQRRILLSRRLFGDEHVHLAMIADGLRSNDPLANRPALEGQVPTGRKRGARKLGARERGARELGARELGARELGARELGGRELDGRELDGRDGVMDFRDDADAAEFRGEFRAWLADSCPSEPAPIGGPERAQFWNDWHRALHGGGWMGLSWPVAYGGRGLPQVYEAILNDEIGLAGAPPAPHVGFLGRALLHFGTEVQKRRYLPPLLSGDEVWCQGFSEPGAGSDLAAVRTRAVLDDDHWVVDGQKVWTSDAAWADRCLLLARTDPSATRHRGISALIVDMADPGVEVRPIVQSNTDTEFNEVFLTGVRVPRDEVVGAPGQGWEIAMTTVGYERGPADVGFSSRYVRTLGELVEAAGRRPPTPASGPIDLARAHVAVQVLRAHVLRSLSARADGAAPGPEGSIDKLLATRVEQLLHHVALDGHGADALTGTEPGVLAEYLYSRATSIAGGSSQIQRTIVAERLLGLPRGR